MSWAPFQIHIGKSHEASGSGHSMTALPDPSKPTLLCLSHLRWNFVYQRPQHLMSRCSKLFQVLFFEEPVPSEGSHAWLEVKLAEKDVRLLIPHIPASLINTHKGAELLRGLLDRYLLISDADPIFWYYTPMSLSFTDHLDAPLVIYDCMDELSAFLGAPTQLIDYERALFKKADIVFTGGYSLYESKRKQHRNAYPFPSSVDIKHFGKARQSEEEPADQAAIPGPKMGFYGVIDERLDVELIRDIAIARPEWQIIMIGPIVKIDPRTLPQHPNIHYLGPKTYDELPAYLSGWDVALMPFAINQSTRFISPTKTPEYLAGGRPVVSTPIHDVVRTYGGSELVFIANDSQAFIQSIDHALKAMEKPSFVCTQADAILNGMSWEKTWDDMYALIDERLRFSQASDYLPVVARTRRLPSRR
ncbi:glycosyltransferase family 1 protein [Methylophilus methylotrophus]|uniref:glycosyltransferase family 1 protein n=1 Tax=Methylophilus methylotrophus TaxID=17 RepID=UPI000367085B|nr:glycosyltransferase family 1 protein [Methylophilus methylotrophus]